MGKMTQGEALQRIGRMLDAGQRPAALVSFRLDDAGAVCVDVVADGGIADTPLLEAALEMAVAGVATAGMVHGRPPRVGGEVRGHGMVLHSVRNGMPQ
jgi:hypothetical protein